MYTDTYFNDFVFMILFIKIVSIYNWVIRDLRFLIIKKSRLKSAATLLSLKEVTMSFQTRFNTLVDYYVNHNKPLPVAYSLAINQIIYEVRRRGYAYPFV